MLTSMRTGSGDVAIRESLLTLRLSPQPPLEWMYSREELFLSPESAEDLSGGPLADLLLILRIAFSSHDIHLTCAHFSQVSSRHDIAAYSRSAISKVRVAETLLLDRVLDRFGDLDGH